MKISMCIFNVSIPAVAPLLPAAAFASNAAQRAFNSSFSFSIFFLVFSWAALSRGAFSRFHAAYNAIHGHIIYVLIFVVRSFIFHTTVMLSYIFKLCVQLSLHAFCSVFAIYPPWKRSPVVFRPNLKALVTRMPVSLLWIFSTRVKALEFEIWPTFSEVVSAMRFQY